jgi:hypothetical protein
MQRFRVTVRMRITGRHRKDFNILMIDIWLDSCVSNRHARFFFSYGVRYTQIWF